MVEECRYMYPFSIHFLKKEMTEKVFVCFPNLYQWWKMRKDVQKIKVSRKRNRNKMESGWWRNKVRENLRLKHKEETFYSVEGISVIFLSLESTHSWNS